MSWIEKQIRLVWQKGAKVQGANPREWRKDVCKAWIRYHSYGNRESDFGWEIDHMNGNENDERFENLQPLQWQNNVAKRDGPLRCVVTSEGPMNVKAR